ncbi:amino acid permease family protein, partial [Chlamydia psittaci 84-8471/1]
VFALWISFLPPQEVTQLSGAYKIGYSAFLLLAFSINCMIPFGIYYAHKKFIK